MKTEMEQRHDRAQNLVLFTHPTHRKDDASSSLTHSLRIMVKTWHFLHASHLCLIKQQIISSAVSRNNAPRCPWHQRGLATG